MRNIEKLRLDEGRERHLMCRKGLPPFHLLCHMVEDDYIAAQDVEAGKMFASILCVINVLINHEGLVVNGAGR